MPNGPGAICYARAHRIGRGEGGLSAWLRLRELAQQIPRSVQYTDDLDSVIHRLIKPDVVANREAAQFIQEFRACSTESRIPGERSALLVDLVEQGVRGFGVVECDLEPDLLEIVLCKNGLPHSRQFGGLSARLVSREPTPAPSLDLGNVQIAGRTALNASLDVAAELAEFRGAQLITFFH